MSSLADIVNKILEIDSPKVDEIKETLQELLALDNSSEDSQQLKLTDKNFVDRIGYLCHKLRCLAFDRFRDNDSLKVLALELHLELISAFPEKFGQQGLQFAESITNWNDVQASSYDVLGQLFVASIGFTFAYSATSVIERATYISVVLLGIVKFQKSAQLSADSLQRSVYKNTGVDLGYIPYVVNKKASELAKLLNHPVISWCFFANKLLICSFLLLLILEDFKMAPEISSLRDHLFRTEQDGWVDALSDTLEGLLYPVFKIMPAALPVFMFLLDYFRGLCVFSKTTSTNSSSYSGFFGDAVELGDVLPTAGHQAALT